MRVSRASLVPLQRWAPRVLEQLGARCDWAALEAELSGCVAGAQFSRPMGEH
jgi:hypothetical protein